MEFRKLRETLNLSVKELADLLEVEESTVWRWEAGKTYPQYKQYEKLKTLQEEHIEPSESNEESQPEQESEEETKEPNQDES